jgi:hypothetical protein
VIKLYQPWPAPVWAARFGHQSALTEIERWVAALRDQGRVAADVDFTVRRRDAGLAGVLHDRAGEHELPPGGFLVFGHDGLRVFDERSFHRRYRALDE